MRVEANSEFKFLPIGKCWSLVLLMVIMLCIVLTGEVLACDVTDIDVWVGSDKADAESGDTTSITLCIGKDDFGVFVEWNAEGGTSDGDFNIQVRERGGGSGQLDSATHADSNTPWEHSFMITPDPEWDEGSSHNVYAKVKRVGFSYHDSKDFMGSDCDVDVAEDGCDANCVGEADCDCPGQGCTNTEFGDASEWTGYPMGGVPSSCSKTFCDGADSERDDDCGNELEVSCCQADGTGGTSGCSYRYFYNDELISSCIWSDEAVNLWEYKTKTSGDNEVVYSKLRHVTQDQDCDEGCAGYSCAKVTIYNCFTCKKDVKWRRVDCPPAEYIFDETYGEVCPGH